MSEHIAGFFELAGRSGRHAGYIETSPSTGANLTLLVQDDLPFDEVRSQFQGRWIYGELQDGKHVTLPVAHLTQHTYGHTAQGVRILTFSCPQALIGEFCFTQAPAEFDAVQLELKWLQKWLGKKVIGGDFVRGKTRLTVGNLPSEVFTIKTDLLEFEIILKQEGWIINRQNGKEIEQRTYVLIVPREAKQLDWFIEQDNNLWKLMSLLAGWESEVRQFKGICLRRSRGYRKSRDFKYQLELPKRNQSRLNRLENSINMNYEVKLHRRYTIFSGKGTWDIELLTRRENSPLFKDVVQNWYLLPSALRHVTALLMVATREDDYYLESRLANLAQAVEATHRALFPESISTLLKSEYRQLNKKFEAWVKTETAPEVAKILANKFGNLNMISFHSRLLELFSPLWEDFIQPHCLSDDLDSLIKEIGKMRNDLSHANNPEDGELQRQRYIVNLLSQMLRIILLEKLGWSLQEAIRLVSRHHVSQSLKMWVTDQRAGQEVS